MVCIPVKSVTVADPPRISMDETMMFVARLPTELGISKHSSVECIPEEHEDKMGDSSPSFTDNFQPGVGIRSVKFEFSGKLREEQDLDSGT
jgi:hypothetical protein